MKTFHQLTNDGFDPVALVRQASELDSWLGQAEQSKHRIWKNFASGLRQDYQAVKAALSLKWSNGPTEGYVNRLKCLKWQMYGRV